MHTLIFSRSGILILFIFLTALGNRISASVPVISPQFKNLFNEIAALKKEGNYKGALKLCETGISAAKKGANTADFALLNTEAGNLCLYFLDKPDQAASKHQQASTSYLRLYDEGSISNKEMSLFIDRVIFRAYEFVQSHEKRNFRFRRALKLYGEINESLTEFLIDSGIQQRKIIKQSDRELQRQTETKRRLLHEKMQLSGLLEASEKEALLLEDSLETAEKSLKIKALHLLQERNRRLEAEREKNQLAQKAAEADRQKIVIWFGAVVLAFLLIVLLLIISNYRRMKSRNQKLREQREELKLLNEDLVFEKDKSDQLLRNILPDDVATELKTNGKVSPRHFDSATVMFTDFEGFTKVAGEIAPEKTVELLNLYFEHFDAIIQGHGLEKIKTIGDGYLCASGVTSKNKADASQVVKAALEMLLCMKTLKANAGLDLPDWELRIGIHTGPVVAGIIGTHKFAYDIWGDTVNIASRLESNGVPGRVNISQNTWQHIQHAFSCEFRGSIEVKNRGGINMYLVEEETDQNA